MWSLYQRVFESDSSIDDKVCYWISSKHLRNVSTDGKYKDILPEKIDQLLASGATRCDGLYLLETTLQQCHDLISYGWVPKLNEVLKSSDPSNSKALACNVLSFLVANLSKAPAHHQEAKDYFYPVIQVIFQNADDSEWIVEALNFLAACAHSFPLVVLHHKDKLKAFLLKYMASSSTKCIEAVASCFAELPACAAKNSEKMYSDQWLRQYFMILNTMQKIMDDFFLVPVGITRTIPEEEEFNIILPLEDSPSQVVEARQFSCLCRCLAKMLSSQTLFRVRIPIHKTLECVCRIFRMEDIIKKNSLTPEDYISLSLLPSMQTSALVLLEAIIINFPCNLMKYTNYIACAFERAIRATTANLQTVEYMGQLHCAIWRVLKIWLKSTGHGGALYIVKSLLIIEELLQDILLEGMQLEGRKALQQSSIKPKEKTMSLIGNQNNIPNLSVASACSEALEALTFIVYTGGKSLEKRVIERIQNTVFHIASMLQFSREFPFPYNHEHCRKNFYDLVLSLAVNTEPTDTQPAMNTLAVFNAGLKDPSFEVRGISLKALCSLRLVLQPRKPYPVSIERTASSQDEMVLNEVENIGKATGWEAKPSWISDSTPSASDAVSVQIVNTYHDGNVSDIEMNNGEFLPTETFSPQHFSKHSEKSHCNGENDLSVLRNSSQSNDEESDEDIEDERSFDEEIPPDVQMMPESFVPSGTPLQNVNPSISSLTEPSNISQEYEELRLEEKYNQAKLLRNCSSRNFHQNSAHSLTGEKLPSTSSNKSLPENGLYSYEDEEMDEEEADEEEEEEEAEFRTERTSPLEYFDTPAKKRKVMNDDEEDEEEEEEEEDDIEEELQEQEEEKETEQEQSSENEIEEIIQEYNEEVQNDIKMEKVEDKFVENVEDMLHTFTIYEADVSS